ncbi:hypothetical protein [Streptomyces himalayensis]|uniref:Lipoprotein n=1 Tax=Streptomyces himalayensis subsp. himalayensis TaxID=2756131 RepID=A0A7W0DR80_9ACTN|nr:hypothetical protein [Streptomyces himalayensis]MBA2949014.1 hypothetical protein [Streptomyces himalayensis subsp. himalayensis]
MNVRRLRGSVAVSLLGVVLASVLAGCGIRPTEVPTDFGAAPSRAPCALTGTDTGTQSARGIPVQVFLVCASQLVTVDRTVQLSGKSAATDRVQVAQALLDQLAETPSEPEKQAKYTTDVRRGMTVSGPREGDPEDTLRLSTRPEDLSAYALAQIICTYANSAAADEDGAVVLGGPTDEPVRRYQCTPEVRSRPSTAPPSEVVSEA